MEEMKSKVINIGEIPMLKGERESGLQEVWLYFGRDPMGNIHVHEDPTWITDDMCGVIEGKVRAIVPRYVWGNDWDSVIYHRIENMLEKRF